MKKTAHRDLLDARSEPRYFTFDTDQLTLVTDKKHHLYDPRVELPVDEALVESILIFGVLDPIKIWRDPNDGTKYVAEGRQRFKAICEANKRLKKKGAEPIRVPAIPKHGEDHVLAGIMITQNFVRQQETPLGKARKIYDYIHKLGRSKEETAKVAGMSVASIDNMLRLLERGTPQLVEAVEKKKIAASAAYKLSKLPPEKQKAKVERLLTEAPRTPGKKRSSNGAKARAITDGVHLRSVADVEAMASKLARLEPWPERKGAIAALDWMRGDSGALDAVVGKGE